MLLIRLDGVRFFLSDWLTDSKRGARSIGADSPGIPSRKSVPPSEPIHAMRLTAIATNAHQSVPSTKSHSFVENTAYYNLR